MNTPAEPAPPGCCPRHDAEHTHYVALDRSHHVLLDLARRARTIQRGITVLLVAMMGALVAVAVAVAGTSPQWWVAQIALYVLLLIHHRTAPPRTLPPRPTAPRCETASP